ncbi:restriction endonuclease subunit S [Shewanella algae]|uniref:restriction endonuclease subunit S n=1 Tax=Shewanella algae TaxID=38313 RepID=UPI0034D69D43
MSCNWPEFTIDEIKAPTKGAIAMGPFGSRIKAENFVDSGVPVLKGGNLHGAYINDSDCDFLTEEKADELKSSVVYEGDIVITHRGTIGQVSIVSDESKYPRYVVSQSQLKISLDKTKVNPYYVNYYLRSRLGQHQLLSFASQVGVPAIAKASTSVKQIRVPCPPLTVQEKIVDFIRIIDRKHTNNSSVNQTLEEMAQAIFKSWFVDFDPVKAKMNGEQPEGMDEATASLFPEKLVESELGLIPEGWEVKPLGDYLTIKRGGSPRPIKDFIVPEGYPWTKIADATANDNPYIFKTKEFIKEEGLKKTVYLKKGTLILSNSATPGLPRFLELDACIHDGWLHFPEKKHFTDSYLYQLFLHIRKHLVAQGNGSVFTNLKTDILRNQVVLVPPKELVDIYEKHASKFLETVKAKSIESNQLAQLRDTLLPKLLSGEIELGTSEELVEAI